MYGRITDKTELSLPQTGVLSDGRTVSNYHLLPESVLFSEGWLPCEEIKPEYNAELQYLVVETAIQQGDIIVVTYKAVEIPIL